MTRCETGACPCDPLNPRKVASNTFLPAIFGLPFFLRRKTVLKTRPDLVLARQPRLSAAGAVAGKQPLHRLFLQIGSERHRPLWAGKLQVQAADDGVDPLVATHLLGPLDDVLDPVIARYAERDLGGRFFRADAAYAIPAIYERLEEARFFYAIRLPANAVLKDKIAHRLTRPVGRPSLTKVKRFFEEFEYQAASWDKERRVIAKIEWHPGELFPRVGFIVTNLPMEPDWVVRFYNQRGTAEQHIKEGKYAFRWTRLSCRKFRDNEVRLQLHALAYNLATFLRCIELPEAMADWSLISLQLKLIKIGARVVRHARTITFQLAEVAVTGTMVRAILAAIRRLRAPPLCA